MNFNFEILKFENRDINPEKLAFGCSDGDMSWRELKELSDKIIDLFKSLQLPQGHPVIIYGHKEKLFPATIVACFMYGVPYIPVDIIMPRERLQKISSISGSQLVINCTSAQIDTNVPININSSFEVSTRGNADFKAIYKHSSGHLAYIMFTSGSTGEPKGVMIPMQAIKSYLDWFKKTFHINSETVFMNQAPFSFDISLFELLGTLYYGASAVLNTYDITRNADKFYERLQKYKCTYWNSTPSFAYIYLTSPVFSSSHFPDMKNFLFMGEELTAKLVKRLRTAFPNSRITNAYGPTEATIVTTSIEITEDILLKYESSLPIGHPKFDGEILINNDSNNPKEEGEIIIVGDHVAAGYLKNEALTNEKFFVHNNKRAYKTGDYGYKKDNLVFYIGRKDEQVKLNGYRIEIGEISKCLEDIDFIAQAVTVPLKAGTQVKKIVSFAQIKGGHTNQNDELKKKAVNALRGRLPEYIVPSDIIFVKDFPVNVNHKVDKTKLVEMYYK